MNKLIQGLVSLATLTILIVGCGQKVMSSTSDIESSATLYSGGDIITMAGEQTEYAEAVVQENGRIAFVGDLKAAEQQFPNAAKKDLKGKTMMPGFIEPHVHPSIAAIMLPNEIIAPYDWVLPNETKKGVTGHEPYIERITQSINENADPDTIYLIWGYHQLWHSELNRDILNKIAPDQAVGIIHRSFHEIYLNDKAITFLKIKETDFADNPQVFWDKGHFYEGGWLALVPKIAPILLNPVRYEKGLSIMTQLIRRNGITTIAEPGFPSSDFNGEYQLLKKEMDKNPPYDCYLIPNGTQLPVMKGGNQQAMDFMETLAETYNTHNIKFLPKQVKLFADGAIYSQLMQLQEGYTDGHHGEWMTPLPILKEQLSFYWKAGYKIHVHANGDKGIQESLDFTAENLRSLARKNHQLTLHHMGYFTDAQAQQIQDLNIETSVNPYYLWALADMYSKNGLGKERAENLVGINSLVKRDIPVSFHSDFSMAPMEPLTLAWTAINRVTSQKNAVSQYQRIPVFDAMKAITIDAARTLDLEAEIGSLLKGKVANFTILDANPFKVNPMKIKDISVYGTVYRGKENIN